MTRRQFLRNLTAVVVNLSVPSMFDFSFSEDVFVYFYGIKVRNYSFGSLEDISQSYLRFFTSIAKSTGVYDPIATNVDTYDCSNFHEYGVYYWDHVDIGQLFRAILDRDVRNRFDIIVRYRLNKDVINTAAFLSKYQIPINIYDQPLLYLFLKWASSSQDFIFLRDDYNFRWLDSYGKDYSIPSHCLVGEDIDDIESDDFWIRKAFNCSTKVGWCIVYGMYKSKSIHLRTYFKNSHHARIAIDCLSPGVLMWIIDRFNLGDEMIIPFKGE